VAAVASAQSWVLDMVSRLRLRRRQGGVLANRLLADLRGDGAEAIAVMLRRVPLEVTLKDSRCRTWWS
jgi:hypothetical protein